VGRNQVLLIEPGDLFVELEQSDINKLNFRSKINFVCLSSWSGQISTSWTSDHKSILFVGRVGAVRYQQAELQITNRFVTEHILQGRQRYSPPRTRPAEPPSRPQIQPSTVSSLSLNPQPQIYELVTNSQSRSVICLITTLNIHLGSVLWWDSCWWWWACWVQFDPNQPHQRQTNRTCTRFGSTLRLVWFGPVWWFRCRQKPEPCRNPRRRILAETPTAPCQNPCAPCLGRIATAQEALHRQCPPIPPPWVVYPSTLNTDLWISY